MKVLLGLCTIAIGLFGALAYSLMQRNSLLGQQVADYDRQNFQLLLQIENNSLNKLETQKQPRRRYSRTFTATRTLPAAQRP
ncbi:MAG: hypothetical protein P8N94_04895 [Gammaproteobacteria bacterium]|nr:hypothetical protein [Gammaproteobacteria bacterium]MDG2337311.1 hypothetical protein [Gammaproteobacteria bacterium]